MRLAWPFGKNRTRSVQPGGAIGYFSDVVLVQIDGEYFTFDRDAFAEMRPRFLREDECIAYSKLLLTPVGLSGRGDLQTFKSRELLENKICAGVGRLASQESFVNHLDGSEPTFGRYEFDRPHLKLGWRLAEASIEHAWRAVGDTTITHVEEPFFGTVVSAPPPLGAFFLPAFDLERIAIWRNTVVFHYVDRSVLLSLKSPTCEVL